MSVIPRPTAYHDWSITTKFGLPSSEPCKPFWIPVFHTLGARGKICKILPISNMSTAGHAKPYSSYNSWSTLVIFGHNTLHRHTLRLTSAVFICALMSKWQPFIWMSVGHATAAATVGWSAALADSVRQCSGRGCYSCHCECDTSCHMTCLVCFSFFFLISFPYFCCLWFNAVHSKLTIC